MVTLVSISLCCSALVASLSRLRYKRDERCSGIGNCSGCSLYARLRRGLAIYAASLHGAVMVALFSNSFYHTLCWMLAGSSSARTLLCSHQRSSCGCSHACACPPGAVLSGLCPGLWLAR